MNQLRVRRSMSVLAAVGAAMLLLSLFASANARAGRPEVQVAPPVLGWTHARSEVSVAARPLDTGAWTLEAHVRDVQAGPIGGCTVRFDAKIELLGVRTVELGTARTDSSGTATLTYRPTWTGTHRIVALAPFDDGTVVSTEAVIEVTGAAPAATPAARLPVIGSWAGPMAALVLAVVWGLLAVVVVRVVLGISRSASVNAGPSGPSTSSRPLGSGGSTSSAKE